MPGDPNTSTDDADVRLTVEITDVRLAGSLDDYGGSLRAEMPLRVTDRENGSANEAGTVLDTVFAFTVPCAVTADTGIGSTCAVNTTADAVMPGSVPKGSRSIWEVAQVDVTDGGADQSGATPGDDSVFMRQGVFAP